MDDIRLSLKAPASFSKKLLALTGFSGEEPISRPFQFQLSFVSDNLDLSAKDAIGANVTVILDHAQGQSRPFNGVIRSIVAGDSGLTTTRLYRAEMVPWLWFLTRGSDCRIFEDCTALDIITEVITDHHQSVDTSGVKGAAPKQKRPYCVQYRETDFHFISRLMEEVGIFYAFKHDDGRHSLYLYDSVSAYTDIPGKTLGYSPGTKLAAALDHWARHLHYHSGSWTQRDYNFEQPSSTLETNSPTKHQFADYKDYALFDYPGGYDTVSDGNPVTELRMEAEEAPYQLVTARSGNMSLFPLGSFTLDDHVIESEKNKKYAILSVSHSAYDHATTPGGSGSGYSCTFSCIPAEIVCRPARVTPKPRISGPQTAIVVGASSSDEITTDKYGRIQVQFPWDRKKKTSCWIRVAQSIAGKQFGAIYLPRVGHEVVVSFLEGDPDRPLVVGSVYNADNMPPYTLPDNKTQSGYKTRSTVNGAASNFNELRFEDKKGSEEVYLQAEKDFNCLVKHDQDLKIGNNQTIEVTNDRTEKVKQGNESVTIQQGNRSVVVNTGNDTHQIGQGNRSVTISMGNDSLEIKMGNQTTKVSLGSVSTEAMQSIELKVGQNSIKIDQMGVTIQGMMVSIEGQTQTQVKGLMTQIGGDAMLQLQGGITMIG